MSALYSDDTIGRLFAKNGKMLTMLMESARFLEMVPVKGLTLEEGKKLQVLKAQIKQFNKEER
jgi:hypothetical protein